MRLLSLSAVATELLYALGASPSIVGRTDDVTYPEAALTLPSIGAPAEVDEQRIAVFEPDLVLIGSSQQAPTQKQVVCIAPQSINDIYAMMLALGSVLDKSVEAELLVHDLRAVLERVHDRCAQFRPLRVYIDTGCADAVPNYMAEVVALAGAELYAGSGDINDIILYNPQIILVYGVAMLDDDAQEEQQARIGARPGWNELQAVKHERLFIVDEGLFRPTPRLADGVRLLAKLFHGVKID